MPQPILTGRCLCGAVRYEYAGPLTDATWCHCETCRRATGTPAVAWVTMQSAHFRFTHGEPRQFASSPPVVRSFCGGCGCALTYKHEQHADQIDVTIASLDDPGLVPPADHTWMSDAIAWNEPRDGLPQYPRGRVPP